MIPVYIPSIGKRERDLLLETVEAGWVSSAAPLVRRFEERFASWVGMEYGVAVSSGTAAIEAALDAVGVTRGDEVIVPNFSILSCSVAPRRLGAVPVPVDADPNTWNLDLDLLEEAITPKTRAILVVHTYGFPVDMPRVMAIAEAHDLLVVEDAAEAHGATVDGRRVGSFGHAAAFSFFANKVITTGEGGMVVSNDPEVARRARGYRDLFFDPKQKFVHEEEGASTRMSALQAALGLGQLEHVEQTLRRKVEIGERYDRAFAGLDDLRLPPKDPRLKNIYWMYAIVLQGKLARRTNAAEFRAALHERGIGTRPFFTGLHAQPVYRDEPFAKRPFPVSDELARNGLYLPSGLGTSDADYEFVIETVRSLVEGG